MNQLSNISPCKSFVYNLYSTNSVASTRTWSRSETSGRLYCCDNNCLDRRIVQALLKYKVLQYQSSNNHGPGIEVKQQNRRTSICPQSSFKIGNIIYQIDTRIATIINQMIKNGELPPSITLSELQFVIAQLRETLNLPSTDPNVLYKNIPYSLKTRYNYRTSDSKGSNLNNNPVQFDIPYRTGIILPLSYSEIVQQLVEAQYQVYFPGFFISKNSQFIYVVRNDAYNFTGKVYDLFPAQNKAQEVTCASRWGTNILTTNSIDLFVRENVRTFEPIAVAIVPGSNKVYGGKYKTKIGVLLDLQNFTLANTDQIKNYFSVKYPTYDSTQLDGLVSVFLADVATVTQQNSQLLFIPVQSQIDLIEHVDYPNQYGVTFQVSNDGVFSTSNYELFAFTHQLNYQYKLLTPKTQRVCQFN